MTIFSKPTAADTPGSPGIEIVHRTEEGDVQAASTDSFSDSGGSDHYTNASTNHAAASSKQGTSIWRDIRTFTIGGAALGAVFAAGRASKTVGAPATYTDVAKAKNNGSKSPKAGKVGKVFSSTIIGRISTDTSSACATEVSQVAAADIAACSRYWLGATASNGNPGYGSTCSGTGAYNAKAGGTENGNVPSLGVNTCLGMGDAATCYDIEGVNDGAPVKIHVSAAWDWSEYNTPAPLPAPGDCAQSQPVLDAATNTCASVLSDSSIPLTPNGETTGWCYDATKLPTIDYDPATFVTNVQFITSTVTITVDNTDYVCNITGEYE